MQYKITLLPNGEQEARTLTEYSSFKDIKAGDTIVNKHGEIGVVTAAGFLTNLSIKYKRGGEFFILEKSFSSPKEVKKASEPLPAYGFPEERIYEDWEVEEDYKSESFSYSGTIGYGFCKVLKYKDPRFTVLDPRNFDAIAEYQQDLPNDIQQIVDDNFSDLVDIWQEKADEIERVEKAIENEGPELVPVEIDEGDLAKQETLNT